MRDFSFERLASMSPGRAGQAAMAAITKVQDYSPEEQAAAAAVMFLLLTRKYEAHPGNVLNVGSNIISRALEQTPELRGVFAYIANEV